MHDDVGLVIFDGSIFWVFLNRVFTYMTIQQGKPSNDALLPLFSDTDRTHPAPLLQQLNIICPLSFT